MRQQSHSHLAQGFTLIELAVVIAIIAILASVAIPRFGDSTAQAEKSLLQDLASQLTSAAAIYTAEQAVEPTSFTNYVDFADVAPAAPLTISVLNFDSKACQSGNSTFTCTGKKWTATYTFTNGAVTVAGTPTNGNTLPSF